MIMYFTCIFSPFDSYPTFNELDVIAFTTIILYMRKLRSKGK